MENNNCFDFTGRRVLITGGAGGIGKATVHALSRLNATVIVMDKDKKLLEELKKEVPSVIALETDICKWNEVERVIKPLMPIHHLINCAGIVEPPTRFLTVGEADFDNILKVNLKALVRVSQVVSQGMINHELRGATIVNVSSVVSSLMVDALFAYGASKAATDYVTKFMASELAPFKIRVNAIRPGLVRTKMAENVSPEEKDLRLKSAFQSQKYHQDFIEPEQVAQALVYLSSPMSEMITGANLTVDAGHLLH